MSNSEIIGAGQDTARRAPKINTITCGDCLEVMQGIPDKSIDMILCDLPYGTTACTWDTIIPFVPLWKQYRRIIKDNGAIVLTASQPFTSALIMSNIKMFKYEWIWIKTRACNFNLVKYRPLKMHENILIFGGKNYYPIKEPKIGSSLQRTKYAYRTEKISEHFKCNERGFRTEDKYPSSYLKINSSVGYHPTQKPVALFEYLIRTYTKEGETVLDNCIGSGTTAVACVNTGRNYIGIEKEEKYCRIAEERIHEEKNPSIH